MTMIMVNENETLRTVPPSAARREQKPVKPKATCGLLIDGDGLRILPKDIERLPDDISASIARSMRSDMSPGHSYGMGRPRHESITLESFAFSTRTGNVIRGLGITTTLQLCNLTCPELLTARNCGTVTIQEILRSLLIRYIRPGWMIGVASRLEYDLTTEAPAGFARITAPILREERWIAECVIADMERDNVPWCVLSQPCDSIAIARHGATITGDDVE